MSDSILDVVPKGRVHAPPRREFVVQKNGQVRHAGSTHAEDRWVTTFRRRAEEHFYVFAKSVMNRPYLTKELHLPICEFIQRVPPRRKLIEVFRGGGKTSLVGHCLPLHMHIQRKAANCYFPNESGREQRGLLIGETLARASDSLRVIRSACEENELLRALWPDCFWPTMKQARKWNDIEVILPRDHEWPDPTFRAIGCGQAITGAHPSYFVKDDLTTIEAANSQVTMQAAIDWHIASRAMLARPTDLEFTICTRWALWDLPAWIEEHDPSVEVFKRALVEEDDAGVEHITYPRFTASDGVAYGYVWEGEEKSVEYLKKDNGVLYPLLYLNKADDPSLVEFQASQLREYRIVDGAIEFDEDERDVALAELKAQAKEHFPRATYVGQQLTPTVMQEIFSRRHEHIRLVT